MDLKLKDELTRILIKEPGLSINELARRTKTYYSYTHRLLVKMEKEGLVDISKIEDGNRSITSVKLTDVYRNEWLHSFKRIMYSLFDNWEVKAALVTMYIFLVVNYFQRPSPRVFSSPEIMALDASATVGTTSTINPLFWVLILIPGLLTYWYLSRKY